ncbi:MAG: ATP-binding protein, partial [Cyanobacteria bacterium J06573_11]
MANAIATQTSVAIANEIKNTGPSIPAEIHSKIFDPFFTTKPIGQGTGLGLAIAYQTMQKHNGSIRINSVPSDSSELIR